MIQRWSTVSSEGVKVLSEGEIQERLYGECLGRRKRQTQPEQPLVSKPLEGLSVAKDSEWTGTEILASELKRLREDLIALRRERERLAAELDQHVHAVQTSSQASSGNSAQRFKKVSWEALLKRITTVSVLVACLGMPIGFRFLQASPVGNELSPYTVQVAVYDVKTLAAEALERLQGMGYPAFFVEYPRRNGRARYRIYVGRFVTKAEAELERQRLVSDPRFSDAFVRLQ